MGSSLWNCYSQLFLNSGIKQLISIGYKPNYSALMVCKRTSERPLTAEAV